MKIALVGAGNVATHLGGALLRAGHEVVQVYSRTEASASVLAERLGTEYTTRVEDICCDAELYIVALTDAALQTLAPRLVQGREEALFVHTAGSMPMSLWEGLTARHGVFYPMQTFSKQRTPDFATIPFFIEANGADDLAVLRTLAESLSPKVYEATSEQRKYLHIAAVFACNFANHMYALSDALLREQGIPFEVMHALIDETARKVHELPPAQGQTGPAVRNDANVMNEHLKMLVSHPEVQELYAKISKSIYQMKENDDQL